MATKIYSIRFDPDLMARVDASGVGRSEFIREAVEAALVASPVKRPAAPSASKKNSSEKSSRWAADDAAVLDVIRGGRFSSRDVEKRIGWMGLRYSKAEKRLLESGAVMVVDGVLVAA
ncbi:hypothetical protein GCM10011360_17600 [Primorskyibacter flagellatus]|uniref:Uncharacterized protein n=1 Tax=Primorskyibacter flagellatus TaxID=1387277 RepID=A0A917EG72_9RHOB|nr:CopG family transcriptional regulator [Primorskyibacter flagellatus]GGE30002.1 hypothetical protein GCM10011360_17600 [Primorskyibacter flagellatus]